MPERPAGPDPQYVRTSVRSALDPIAAAVMLVREAPAPFMVYERAGEVSVAAGAAAEIVLDRREVRVRIGTRWSAAPTGDQPLQQVHRWLADLDIAHWRAYGWINFELSYLLHGMPESAGSGPLLHLIVPERETRITDRSSELRAMRADDLAETCAQLATGPEHPVLSTRRCHVDDSAGTEPYRLAVAAAIGDIRARRLQKVILSRVVRVPGTVDLVATYRAARQANTPARSFLLDLGGIRAAGFSPETVVEVDANGVISTQPLAGTRALSGVDLVDAGLRADLLSDPKEVFEHAVSVQAAQEEIMSLCRAGSVRVEDFMTVQSRGSVQHLGSRVTGRLGAGRNCWHAVAALFPAITASGMPKAAACEAIHRYETEPRGLYSGAVVVADADGGLDAALVLRTVFQRNGRTWLRAGAGLVGQSTPDRELEETREKLRSVSPFLVPTTAPVSAHGAEVVR